MKPQHSLTLLAAALVGLADPTRAANPADLRTQNGWINPTSGNLVVRVRPDASSTAATPEQRARNVAGALADGLGFAETGANRLTMRSVRQHLAGETVRFDQAIEGVVVRGAGVAVTLDREGRALYVDSRVTPAVDHRGSAKPTVGREVARATAKRWIGGLHSYDLDTATLQWLPSEAGLQLIWSIRLAPRGLTIGEWDVLVDAHTGEVLDAVDLAVYGTPTTVDGTGMIFDPDPLSSAQATYGTTGFVDGSDANTAQMTAQRRAVTLREITLDSGTHSLTGPWAEVQDFESPFKGLFSQASADFSFDRNADAFEAVMVYWHIDNIMRYLNVDLGLDIRPTLYTTGVRVDPSGLSGGDNSHYLGGSQRLAFGEGGVDDAEDADVIVHELGHGLHDWVTNGNLSQVNGLSEGTGDYAAQSYSRSLGQWNSGQAAYHWTFSWDGHNPFWGGRTTNYGALYPAGLVGQIHTDGQIWATCNMKVWDAIGARRTDLAFWTGLGMTGSSTNQEQAAAAVLAAAEVLADSHTGGWSAAAVWSMEAIYQACGYAVDATVEQTFTDGFESGDTTGWTATVP